MINRDQFQKLSQQRLLNFDAVPVGREDSQKKTHLITDIGSVPSIGQAIWQAFRVDLRISEKQIDEGLKARVKTKDGGNFPSPQEEYAANKDLFLEYLKTLPKFMKALDMRVNTGNVIKVIRGYDWKSGSWLDYKRKHSVAQTKFIDRSSGL